jgi:hypothetical protein
MKSQFSYQDFDLLASIGGKKDRTVRLGGPGHRRASAWGGVVEDN